MNHQRSGISVSSAMWFTAETVPGSAWIPTSSPRNFMVTFKNLHFSPFSMTLASWSLIRTASSLLLCFAWLAHCMMVLSSSSRSAPNCGAQTNSKGLLQMHRLALWFLFPCVECCMFKDHASLDDEMLIELLFYSSIFLLVSLCKRKKYFLPRRQCSKSLCLSVEVYLSY